MADNYRPEDIPSSPYYLHPSENPSLLLVTNVLTGPNYHSWCRAMRKALISKNKLRFIDGTIEIPDRDHASFYAWDRCNNMVCSWLTRAVSDSISDSLSCIDNAIDMLWDEFASLRPVPRFYCVPACSCSLLKTIKDYSTNDIAISFVKGLNDNYGVIKSQIMMMEPLPPINKAFFMIIQHERKFGLINSSNDAIAFMDKGNSTDNHDDCGSSKQGESYVNYRGNFHSSGGHGNSGNYGKQRKFNYSQSKKPICSYCGMEGHTEDICYKKHGYPPNYFKNKRNNIPQANQVEFDNQYEHSSADSYDREIPFKSEQSDAQFPFTKD
ncbi:uncharacterized protein LOC126665339 [Mercurialis annua]|uniref:uncharacterized protein LOC126665339 n=1 Tax=Mercurialis annua TaxID=3986 RepID=UPI002160821A|nr:uncharacterized protein LOC126665339 [Mercurialis annua]